MEQICRTIFGLVTITPQIRSGQPSVYGFLVFSRLGWRPAAARRTQPRARRPCDSTWLPTLARLNPLFLTPDAASVELQAARLVFEPFIDLDPRGRPQPALLAEIPTRRNGGISADGRTIRYRLRPGVRWSDGRPVTAADVLFTLRAILDPRNPVRSHEGYELIDRASAQGPRTVVFHLARPWAPAVMTYFSYGTSPQFVLPSHILSAEVPLARAAFNAAPIVGDGPYRFVSWRRGEGLALRRERSLLARPAAGCRSGNSDDTRPVDESALAAVGSARLESTRPRATRGRPPRSESRLPHGADRGGRRPCVQHRASPARRRARSSCNRDVDRPQRNLAKDHARLLSGDEHDPAAILVGVRSFGAPAGVRSGCRRSAPRPRRLAARSRRSAPA